ncbi:MAG: ABC transporter substrate-binding protein [Calothrix sp. MO_192.B10]|nr:ABC transporter substrate-binding protein [Calothrix sp. MO_192.B10]
MKNSVARRNPYVIGRPIDERELFVGREGLFSFIEDNLRQGQQVILLHGQRRIGKSSIIRNIPKFVALDEFLFVPFDLEHYTRDNISNIFFEMAQEIVEHLQLSTNNVKIPALEELEQEPFVFYSRFLPQVYPEIDNQNLVLLLDEFDVPINNEDSSQILEKLFTYLDSILELDKKLFVILFLGRQSTDMPNVIGTFKNAPIAEIGFLDEANSTKLITEPAEGILKYEPEAIQEIIKLSAGHPYFTQSICFAVFGRARELEKWEVTQEDVNATVDKAIELAEAGLAWFWDGLSIWEQVVFAAVAEAQKISQQQSHKNPEDPLKLIQKHGFLRTKYLRTAAKELVKNVFVDDTGRKVKIEFVRRWLVQHHPLEQEIRELEKIEKKEINPIYEIGKQQLPEEQHIHNIESEAWEFNPSYFSPMPAPADGYFKLNRTYKFHPIHNKEGLSRTRTLEYENKLLKKLRFYQQKPEFNRGLSNELDRRFAWEKKQKIETFEHQDFSHVSDGKLNSTFSILSYLKLYLKNQNKQKVIFVGTLALVTVIIGFASLGVSKIPKLCTPSEDKVLGIFCQSNPSAYISNGNRTLFPITANTNLKQGITAFKKEDYKRAAIFFEQALKNDPNDPEALIYYNNARAIKKGDPLTLAAIVPAENNEESTAKEILRGVAQAQNQFNKRNGLNGKLLKVVIANDGNEPKQAEQVAEELVKDKNLLGVIGHANSDATKAALMKYQEARLAVISPTNTSAIKSNVFFRTVNSEAMTANKLAEYASDQLNLNKVVIFSNPDSPYSRSLTREFKKRFEQLKGKVVRKSLIDLTAPKMDVKEEVKTTLDKYQPEAVVLFPDTQHTTVALQIATASKEQKEQMDIPDNPDSQGLQLLAGDSLYSSKTLTAWGNNVEGLIIAVPWFREAPQAQNFAQEAAKQWEGAVSWRTATSFDATVALINSFSEKPNRTTILQNLKNVNLSASETSGYPLQFQQGERQNEPVLVKVKGGKFVEVTK